MGLQLAAWWRMVLTRRETGLVLEGSRMIKAWGRKLICGEAPNPPTKHPKSDTSSGPRFWDR